MHEAKRILSNARDDMICNVRYLLICIALIVVGVGVNPVLAQDRDYKDQYDWVVQVLAYRNGELINQGTGFVAASPSVVVTALHLLEKSDEQVVIFSDGTQGRADIRHKDAETDMAILDIAGTIPVPPMMAARSLRQNDTARIYGYWIDGLEEKRDQGILGLFQGSFPDYVAKKVSVQRNAITVVQDSNKLATTYIAQTGRGAYGAPLVNRCGEVVAFYGAPSNKSLEQLWLREKIDAKRTAVSLDTITSTLKSLSLDPNVASKPCLEHSEIALKEKEIAEKKARQAEKEAKEAKKRAEAESKKKQEAEQAKEDKEKEVEETAKVTEQVATERDIEVKKRSALEALVEDYKNYLIIGVILFVLIVFALFSVLRKRKRALNVTQQELSDINAPRTNYIFSGFDSQGSPIALKVLGSDLYKSPGGLLVGRNPNSVQLVVADETVSRVHAKLYLKDERLFLEDYGSSGGTSVNGERVDASQSTELMNGVALQLGDVILEVRFEEPL